MLAQFLNDYVANLAIINVGTRAKQRFLACEQIHDFYAVCHPLNKANARSEMIFHFGLIRACICTRTEQAIARVQRELDSFCASGSNLTLDARVLRRR